MSDRSAIEDGGRLGVPLTPSLTQVTLGSVIVASVGVLVGHA